MSVTNDCIEGLDLLTTICIGNLYLFEGFKKKVLDSQEISVLCKRCKSSNSHTNERGAGYRLVRRNLLRLTTGFGLGYHLELSTRFGWAWGWAPYCLSTVSVLALG
jgi:hypothetical protein